MARLVKSRLAPSLRPGTLGAPVLAACTDRDGGDNETGHRETTNATHDKATVVDVWARERSSQLAALVDHALPDEGLTEAEIAFCCWTADGGDGTVLGLPSGDGAIAVNVADEGPRRIGYIKLVAVDPAAQRRGHGRALVEAAQHWAFASGAAEVRVGAAAPFYLWPGCDVDHLAALCLFESLGYWAVGAELNMRCADRAPRRPAEGRRACYASRTATWATPSSRSCVASGRTGSRKRSRGIELGTCFAALADDDPSVALGYASHSVNRRGWVGPMATDQTRQHGGIGSALLACLCEDMQAQGLDEAEIAWVGPVRFYAEGGGRAGVAGVPLAHAASARCSSRSCR